ncbi:hypothetical protein [Streptomyces muensis]|uniref:Uncharacterized protein n=1 Tax=Streptomyces muensis TaxID=1077944 RepID=A0A9X1PZ31_STRM4|nr:hypothetical protein [Streptomyces muensis]MCF1596017.1 hypothetical protein [Streptomyces muensis]
MTTATDPTTLADAVERHLGDPYDDTNPFGFRAILTASETGQPVGADGALPFPVPPAAAQSGPEPWLHALRALYRRSPRLARTVPTPSFGAGLPTAALHIGAGVGALDSALRITVRHLRTRWLYGAAAGEIPRLREVLCGALADLLLCDALTTLAVRGTDALPTRQGAHQRAVCHLVPRALQGALDRLSVVMGSRFYIRVGEHAAFQLLLGETQRELFAPGRQPHPDPAPVPLADLITAPAVSALLDPAIAQAAPGHARASGRRRAPEPSGPVQERLYAELTRRYDTARSFDLAERPLPDRP